MTETQLALFDYTALDPESRIVVQQRTAEIRSLMRRTAQDIIEIGQKLIDVKARLGHGQFGGWLKAEFEMSHETAAKFMGVAENAANGAIYLTGDDLNNIQRSALYLLAAPSTPYHVRVSAVNLAKQGVEVTHKIAKALVSGQSAAFFKYADEAELEAAIAARLSASGIPCKRQVGCAVGRADIVTPSAIYEIKHPIDRESLFAAIGQVLLYRACINPQARAVVAFVTPRTGEFDIYIEAARSAGVEVLPWTL